MVIIGCSNSMYHNWLSKCRRLKNFKIRPKKSKSTKYLDKNVKTAGINAWYGLNTV